jgi:hypothetical protein
MEIVRRRRDLPYFLAPGRAIASDRRGGVRIVFAAGDGRLYRHDLPREE